MFFFCVMLGALWRLRDEGTRHTWALPGRSLLSSNIHACTVESQESRGAAARPQPTVTYALDLWPQQWILTQSQHCGKATVRCFLVVKIWCAREQLTLETNVLPRSNSHQPQSLGVGCVRVHVWNHRGKPALARQDKRVGMSSRHGHLPRLGFLWLSSTRSPKASWGGMHCFGFTTLRSHSNPQGSWNSNWAGSWMQELMQSPWRITAYWPASFPRLDLIYYMLRTTYTGVVPPVVGWTFSHRSLIKQTSYRLAYKPIIKTFPKLKLLLPDNSGLCQVTETLASKGPDKVMEQ